MSAGAGEDIGYGETEVPMARAMFNGQVIAESDDVRRVDGNAYFPPASLRMEFFRPSDHHTVCGWKGTASYYDVVVGDRVASGAAWYYPDPKPAAEEIRGYIAFWKGVEVRDPR
jgi:uncharacterized protein (DUF427 family)